MDIPRLGAALMLGAAPILMLGAALMLGVALGAHVASSGRQMESSQMHLQQLLVPPDEQT
jgi:hypothetical protein